MIKVFNILSRTFCLLLMMHLLAVSVCDDYLLKIINKSTIEQPFDIEEDTDDNVKDKTLEFDDEYLVNSPNHFDICHLFLLEYKLSKVSFKYLQIALPQSNNKILIPPPRA